MNDQYTTILFSVKKKQTQAFFKMLKQQTNAAKYCILLQLSIKF
jgi:hypothetical protein